MGCSCKIMLPGRHYPLVRPKVFTTKLGFSDMTKTRLVLIRILTVLVVGELYQVPVWTSSSLGGWEPLLYFIDQWFLTPSSSTKLVLHSWQFNNILYSLKGAAVSYSPVTARLCAGGIEVWIEGQNGPCMGRCMVVVMTWGVYNNVLYYLDDGVGWEEDLWGGT